jgi:hypothetical protein
MQLSDFDLRQMDIDCLRSLPPEQRRVVAEKLLVDLKAARESAHPTPQHSSRPPSSRAPWQSGQAPADPEEAAEAHGKAPLKEDPQCAATAPQGEPKALGQVPQAVAPRKAGTG